MRRTFTLALALTALLLPSGIAHAGIVKVTVSKSGMLGLVTVNTADEDEEITVSEQADGSYLLTPGPGTSLRIGNNDFTTAQVVDGVTRGLSAKLGDEGDILILTGVSFPATVKVDLGSGDNTLVMSNSTLGGTLSVRSLSDDDTVTFTGVGNAIAGDCLLQLGDGTNQVNLGGIRLLVGRLRFDGGAGDDSLVTVGSPSSITALKGGVCFNGQGGANTLMLGGPTTQVDITGPLKVTGTGTSTLAELHGARFTTSSIKGKFKDGDHSLVVDADDIHVIDSNVWKCGDGTGEFRVDGGSALVGKLVKVTLGDGPGHVEMESSSIHIGAGVMFKVGDMGGGSGVVRLNGSTVTTVGGSVRYSGGDGNIDMDVFCLNSLLIEGDVQMKRGAGDGLCRVASNGGLLVAGDVRTQRSGSEGSSNVFGGATGDATIVGGVSMSGGSLHQVLMNGGVGGDVRLTGATNVCGISTNGTGPLRFSGNLSMDMAASDALSTHTSINATIVHGSTKITTGNPDDTVSIRSSTFLGSLSVKTGDGPDSLLIQQSGTSTRCVGSVKADMGPGDDNCLVGGDDPGDERIDFEAAVQLDGGAGTDTLFVGNQVMFDPKFPLKAVRFE